MVRIVLVALASLLLVGMQREGLLHEVDHLRAKVAVGHDKVLQKSLGNDCVECALLASGSTVAPPVPSSFLLAQVADTGVARAVVAERARLRPSPYLSRAPPILL